MNARCPLEPEQRRCSECPYWPLCIQADCEAWNEPENRPVDWYHQVDDARKAWQ